MTAMFSKVWIINIVLAVLILFCWVRIWEGRDASQDLLAHPGPSEKAAAAPETSRSAIARTVSGPGPEFEYEGIVGKNLFSSERTFVPRIDEPEVVVEDEVRISGEKIVLYGVVLLDEIKKALINNPMRKPGDREFIWVSEGENLSNLRITQIEAEQLLLNDGTAHYKIGLYDPGKRRSQTTPTRRASAPQQRDVPQVISADPMPVPASPVRAGNGAKTATSAKPRPTEASKQSIDENDDDEYQIIDTPFGVIRRKKPK